MRPDIPALPPPPRREKRLLNFIARSDEIDALKAHAAARNMTMSALLRAMIAHFGYDKLPETP